MRQVARGVGVRASCCCAPSFLILRLPAPVPTSRSICTTCSGLRASSICSARACAAPDCRRRRPPRYRIDGWTELRLRTTLRQQNRTLIGYDHHDRSDLRAARRGRAGHLGGGGGGPGHRACDIPPPDRRRSRAEGPTRSAGRRRRSAATSPRCRRRGYSTRRGVRHPPTIPSMPAFAPGQIVLVDWRDALPKEPNKRRPAVVVEDAELFHPSYPNVILVPLTADLDGRGGAIRADRSHHRKWLRQGLLRRFPARRWDIEGTRARHAIQDHFGPTRAHPPPDRRHDRPRLSIAGREAGRASSNWVLLRFRRRQIGVLEHFGDRNLDPDLRHP